MNHVFDEVIRKTDGFSEFKIAKDSKTNTTAVDVTFQTEDYTKFVDLKDKIDEAKFFVVGQNLNSNKQERTDGATSTSYYVNKITMNVTDKGKEEAALTDAEKEAREALNNSTGKTDKSGETSKTEQSGQASQASQSSEQSSKASA